MKIIGNVLPDKPKQSWKYLVGHGGDTNKGRKESIEERGDVEHVIYTCRALI